MACGDEAKDGISKISRRKEKEGEKKREEDQEMGTGCM